MTAFPHNEVEVYFYLGPKNADNERKHTYLDAHVTIDGGWIMVVQATQAMMYPATNVQWVQVCEVQ